MPLIEMMVHPLSHFDASLSTLFLSINEAWSRREDIIQPTPPLPKITNHLALFDILGVTVLLLHQVEEGGEGKHQGYTYNYAYQICNTVI